MAKDIASLSDAELQAENYRLQAERTAIGEKQEKLIQEFSRRKQLKRAEALLAGVTDAERDVIIAVATAQITAAAGAVEGVEG